jgi:WD40 repeat protein
MATLDIGVPVFYLVAFSQDGKVVAIGGADKLIRFWPVPTGSAP